MDFQYEDWETRYRGIRSNDEKGEIYRLNFSLGVGIYAGVPRGHRFSIVFKTKEKSLHLPQSEFLKVDYAQNKDGEFLTTLETKADEYSDVLYIFAIDLVRYVENVDIESAAVKRIQARYSQWKGLFSSSHEKMPIETQRGLLGELLFLKDYMFTNFTYEEAIAAWSGAKKTSKDFAFSKYWYEVKTAKSTASEITISSVAQLSGPLPGQLVVYRLDEIAPTYENPKAATILEVARAIYKQISSDMDVVREFFERLSMLKFPLQLLLTDSKDAENRFEKFIVEGPNFYNVGDDFPRITDTACFDGAVSSVRYTLLLNMLSKFEVKEMLK